MRSWIAFCVMGLAVMPVREALGITLANTELRSVYQPIIERNPFGLRPPPPPATNAPAAKVEDPLADKKIYLTGLVTVGYPKIPKRAYIMTSEEKKKDANIYYSLNEGQRSGDGEVEVLQIDEKSQPASVKVRWGATETLLTFKTHGITPPAAPAAAVAGKPGAPGVPGAAPGVPGQPGYHPGNGAPAGNERYGNGASRQIPTRPVRRGPDGTAPMVGSQPNLPQAYSPPSSPPSQPVDAAQQYLNMRLQEEAARKSGMFLPPTPPL